MAQKTPQPAPRKPRADAQRNRQRILEIARNKLSPNPESTSAWMKSPGRPEWDRELCTATSPLAKLSSRRSIGPRWKKLAAAEQRFAGTMAPIEALRAWMLLFVDYIAAKQIIAPALNKAIGLSVEGFSNAPAIWSKEPSTVWLIVPSRAATSAPTLIRWTCCGLWSASPTSPPRRTGPRAPEDLYTSSLRARGRTCRFAERHRHSILGNRARLRANR